MTALAVTVPESAGLEAMAELETAAVEGGEPGPVCPPAVEAAATDVDGGGPPAALSAEQEAEIAALDSVLAQLDEIRSQACGQRRFGAGDPWPLFIRKMRALTPQSYGVRVQNWLARFYGWQSVPGRLDRGDVVDAGGAYHEVKVTFITASNPIANFVQIRPHQDIAGYHCFVVDTSYEVTHLWLSKEQMAAELELVGSSAHGTKQAVADNTTREYSVRFRWDLADPTTRRWLDTYRADGPVPA